MSSLRDLAKLVVDALRPLELLADPGMFRALVLRFGWRASQVPPSWAAFADPVSRLATAVDSLGEDPALEQIIDALGAVDDLHARLADLTEAPPDVDGAAFLADMRELLIDRLLIDYLSRRSPIVFALLALLGLIIAEPRKQEGGRGPHVRYRFVPERLGTLLRDPSSLPDAVLGWRTLSFDADWLTGLLFELLVRLRLPARLERSAATTPTVGGVAINGNVIRVTLFDRGGTVPLRLGFVVAVLPAKSGGPGLVIAPWIPGVTDGGAIPIGPDADLRILSGGGQPLEIALLVRPDDATVRWPGDTFRGPIRVELVIRRPARLGSQSGTRLELAGATCSLGVERDVRGDAIEARLRADGAAFVLAAGDQDGFLGHLLGGRALRIPFPAELRFSSRDGVSFVLAGATGGLSGPLRIGPVTIEDPKLSVAAPDDVVALEVTAGLGVMLGPVGVRLDRLGARVALDTSSRGLLGMGTLDARPLWPTGAGLSINGGLVTGGGYLLFDPDHGEYAGALELEFADFLALKAVGLITTRMPDGSDDFSLLIVITTEFPGGLQLGYGFKLLSVGGLLGLNRTMRLDALLEGVRTGAIESVMFPRDVIANAPRILSDLKAFFPPRPGTFLIGPMAKIGWGTPTLISVAVGVIIEIPGNIAIVGVVKVALPSEDEAILLLQVNFAGAIEFDRKRIWFFASLFESRVLTLTIDGELGLLVAYGDEPNFVLTVGGFHPAFVAPALPFPMPKRVAINILHTDTARIAVSGYFAVTSNTAQFGAAAELYFGFSSFSVRGHIGFDALFRFSPFSFIIEVRASVSLKAFGVGVFSISLRFSLEGPTPWRARGTGSISLLFFDISADFDITWGEERDTTLPSIPVLPLLAAEFAKPEGWRTLAPSGGKPLVTLRVLPEAERDLVLHPLGTLFVVQRAVPLDIRLDKVGSQAVSDVSRCTIEVASEGLVKRSDPQEKFALAQFQHMDDAAKLSRPAFESEHAGVELGSDGTALASQRVTRRSTRYEEIVIDPIIRQEPKDPRLTTYNTTLFNHFLRGASVSRSPLSKAEAELRQPYAETIKVTGDSYAIASTRDNTAAGPTFTSHAQARDYLAGRLAEDPSLTDGLHIIPLTEVAA